jgi:hypothetical protein
MDGLVSYRTGVLREVQIDCPYCGEPGALDIDTSGGAEQSYVEDCHVCCRPMAVRVECRPGEILSVEVSAD